MGPELQKRIAALAADRESGASEILDATIAILRDALERGGDVPAVARAVCAAQPQMAPVYNAALAALAARGQPERFVRFTARVARAPQALTRFATGCLVERANAGTADRAYVPQGQPLRLATISCSRTVIQVIEALVRVCPVRVACSESRPALEGRKLASRLAALGVPVTIFSDAALGHALDAVDAVVVGADAVAPAYFLNKSGTRMLAAAATLQGVPVYVLASRDKFVSQAVAARLHAREGAASEVWPDPPAGVVVRNPYFEPTSLDLVSSVISDLGVLGAALVPGVCESLTDDAGVLALL